LGDKVKEIQDNINEVKANLKANYSKTIETVKSINEVNDKITVRIDSIQYYIKERTQQHDKQGR
jgi:hypothetical protein